MLIAVAILTLFLPFSDSSVNYCGATMCGETDAHTFCQFSKGPGPTCSGYIDDRLSGEEKARVVSRMNRRRSEVAQGSLQQLPPASNMLKLRWVEELAREAQIWADQCNAPSDPEAHDECRDLYAITVGQCVASVVGEAPGLRPESMVDMWYLQGRQYKGNIIIRPKSDEKSPLDFAQMLWADTYLVGCARSRFMSDFDGRSRSVTRLVCNFAPRGPVGPLWRPGARASDCPQRSRPDPELPGLCTFHHAAAFTNNIANETVLKEQLVWDTILEIEHNDSLDFHGSLDQIYLTKKIAANISQEIDNESTPIYTIEKRNNVVTVIPDNKKALKNKTDDITNVIDNIIAQMIETTARVNKKKLSTIGRHKSYDEEELNSSQFSKNETRRPTEIDKADETYNDYEFDMNIEKDRNYFTSDVENNVTVSIMKAMGSGIATEMMTTIKSLTNIFIPFETIHSSPREIDDVTLKTSIENENATLYVQNDMLKRLLELSEKAEQNPSDPETARELQEALLRMEQALESPSPKVRRELRSNEIEEDQDAIKYKQSPKIAEVTEKTRGQQFKEIGTPDSAPILNILTKYAPFMKSYESMFRRSSAVTASVNLVLFVLSSVVSNSL